MFERIKIIILFPLKNIILIGFIPFSPIICFKNKRSGGVGVQGELGEQGELREQGELGKMGKMGKMGEMGKMGKQGKRITHEP
ncbi:MAG: hypothetical protein RIE73_25725 [Coleofasciculus sp. C1-SOL-03]|uniref:hypothetical protein n=1 Tax=Coleofasciculus sp. C1-SOL-03 TaxID=3069522 RepID=UPI0032F7F2C9